MPNDTQTVERVQPEGRATISIPADVHREMRIEAAHNGNTFQQLIRAMWEAYKAANPQPWRKPKKRDSAA